MEFTITLQLFFSFALFVLICATVLLASYVYDKKGWVSSLAFILGVVLIFVFGKQCSTATIITCYSDGSTKVAEYLYKYYDSMGNGYDFENGTYVFYEGLGETGLRSTCELTVFPIVYTSDRTKIGSAVEKQVVERISLEPYSLHKISHAINYPFKSVPNKLETVDSFEKEEVVWSLQYTENLEDYVPLYHELRYMCPDTY